MLNSEVNIIEKRLEITLCFKDEMSGRNETFYSIFIHPYKKCEPALNFNDEREYIVNIYSSNNTGNMEDDANGKKMKFIRYELRI